VVQFQENVRGVKSSLNTSPWLSSHRCLSAMVLQEFSQLPLEFSCVFKIFHEVVVVRLVRARYKSAVASYFCCLRERRREQSKRQAILGQNARHKI